MSGAYDPRRVTPRTPDRGPGRPGRRRPAAADVRAELPGRTAAGGDAGGPGRGGPQPGHRESRGTSPSKAGSIPRPTSKTPPIAPSSSDGHGCRSGGRRAGRTSTTTANASRSRSVTASIRSPSTTRRSTTGSSWSFANRRGRRPTSRTGCRTGRRRRPRPGCGSSRSRRSSTRSWSACRCSIRRARRSISAGRGRPLILTTLERPEAMRILARGESRRPDAGPGVARRRTRAGRRRARLGAGRGHLVSSRSALAAVVTVVGGLAGGRDHGAGGDTPAERGGRRRPAQRGPGPRPRGRSGLRGAGRGGDRTGRDRADPRLSPGDLARSRLTPPGPSAYWQEL